MLDLIICANFGVEKLRGLGNTMGQIFEFPIEMAGHPYNRAGTTAQPEIKYCFSTGGEFSGLYPHIQNRNKAQSPTFGLKSPLSGSFPSPGEVLLRV